MVERFHLWLSNDEGQTFVEYALILAVVAVGLAALWTSLGTVIQTAITAVVAAL